ncbi:hypothetical protein M2306_001304 [Myroides gitamensis]|uniref:nitrogen regulatory IIA protein n=1 Tax=Myroides odoratus TaxID=256 RepID=UPI00216A636A|nr:nitrogen regulatory IIA protein [Myroides odoratus]MCS4239856.1 hypothetical protein [Myroides odoratus]MDH6600610.1 hypothetical protein [Myroides gitamensis]
MKKLRATITDYFDKLNDRFSALPLRKQKQYTLYFFVGYLLLTAIVIWKIWYDAGKSYKTIDIKHIENPVLKKKKASTSLQDTLLLFKKQEL